MKIPTGIDIWGDTDYRGKCPHEDVELMMLIDYINKKYNDVICIHAKNEGKRTFRQAAIDRAKGALNKGASDIILIKCTENHPVLFIEMKRLDHTKSQITDEQIDFLKKANNGNIGCIALGFGGAKNAVITWYRGQY